MLMSRAVDHRAARQAGAAQPTGPRDEPQGRTPRAPAADPRYFAFFFALTGLPSTISYSTISPVFRSSAMMSATLI